MVIISSFFSMVFSSGILIFSLVCLWFLYKKMGEPGWKAIVPFYSNYTLFKQVWKGFVYFAYLIAVIVQVFSCTYFMVLYFLYKGAATSVAEPSVYSFLIAICLFAISSIIAFVISLIRNWKISECFGHGIGYFLGLTFLPVVFFAVLAFDQSKYCVEIDATVNGVGEENYYGQEL